MADAAGGRDGEKFGVWGFEAGERGGNFRCEEMESFMVFTELKR